MSTARVLQPSQRSVARAESCSMRFPGRTRFAGLDSSETLSTLSGPTAMSRLCLLAAIRQDSSGISTSGRCDLDSLEGASSSWYFFYSVPRATFPGLFRLGGDRFDRQGEGALLVRAHRTDADQFMGDFFVAVVTYRHDDRVFPRLAIGGMPDAALDA